MEGRTHFNNPVHFSRLVSGFRSPQTLNQVKTSAENKLYYFLCTLWQQKWSGRTSQRALSFQHGHEGETMAPLTWGWPPPAPTPANIKKMLLIINWELSVFSLSGILAMHWLSRPSAAMLLSPQIQLQCRVHCLLLHKQHKKAGLLFVP